MKTSFAISCLATALLLAVSARADERPDHYEGEASETLQQAFANFAETNKRIAGILAQKEVTMADLAKIHELSYTLENALERIDDEYDELADQLEALHLASEGADIVYARGLGQAYLENAGRFPQ
ncbi:MAG: DUF6746 family protein [Pseudomonadota bacterium]